MGLGGLHVLQGNFKHFRTLAAEGPAAEPAAVVVVVDANHLIKLIIGVQRHTGSLVELGVCGGTRRRSHAEGAMGKAYRWSWESGVMKAEWKKLVSWMGWMQPKLHGNKGMDQSWRPCSLRKVLFDTEASPGAGMPTGRLGA